MAGGGRLPLVTIESAGTKYDLRDLLLGGSVAIAVEALQHPTQSSALLQGQSRVRWNSTCVKGGKKAADRFKPVEPLDAEWHERAERGASGSDTGANDLDALSVAKVIEEKGMTFDVRCEGRFDCRIIFSACGKNGWRLCKYDGACILLR